MSQKYIGSKRLQEIDTIRLVANYLVVVIHSVCVLQWVEHMGLEFAFWNYCSQMIAPIAMPTLFFISGYVFFSGSDSYTLKIRKRIGRLVIPYICWNMIFIIGYFMACWFGIRKMQESNNLFLLLNWVRLKIFSLTAAPADMPTWYLRAIFIYGLAAPIIKVILAGRYRLIRFSILLIGIALLDGVITYLGLESKVVYTFPTYSIACFSIGAGLAINRIGLSALWGDRWFVFLILGITMLLLSQQCFMPKCLSPFLQVGMVLILFSLGGRLVEYKFPNVLGEASFFVYVSHIAVLPLVARIGAYIFIGFPFACSFTMIFSIVVSICICLCFYIFIQKHLPILSTILNGRFRI